MAPPPHLSPPSTTPIRLGFETALVRVRNQRRQSGGRGTTLSDARLPFSFVGHQSPGHVERALDPKGPSMNLLKPLATVACLTLASMTIQTSAQAAVPHKWQNCTIVNHRLPHGVGLQHAHDHTSGTPVTSFRH